MHNRRYTACSLHTSIEYSLCMDIKDSYHWWYVEVPGKDAPVGVVIPTRYTLKTNLSFVPGNALKKQANKRRLKRAVIILQAHNIVRIWTLEVEQC